MAVDAPPPRSTAERRELGRAARVTVPREAHADVTATPDRPDPIDVITRGDGERLELLVPVRLGRMAATPFAFSRGALAVMASDLAATPTTGLTVQLVGDAHLASFAIVSGPGRSLALEPTEWHDTAPGPWEWDVKRLATSLVLAGRHLGFDDDATRLLADRAVESYAAAMATSAELTTIDRWFARTDDAALRAALTDKRLRKRRAGQRHRSDLRATAKLTSVVDGERRFVADPPLLIPLEHAEHTDRTAALRASLRSAFESFRAEAPDHVNHLLDRFRVVDDAVRATGVGSVGHRGLLLLLDGGDGSDHLVVDVVTATPSVFATHLGPSHHDHPGRRIAEGVRFVTTTPDPLLGWATGDDGREVAIHAHHDQRSVADLVAPDERRMSFLAGMCGWTLAGAHARSGDPVAISAYLGGGGKFGDAVATFAFHYADQVDRDYLAFLDAIRDGRIDAVRDD
jgi:uncharacterized protein (DUF2252 family)